MRLCILPCALLEEEDFMGEGCAASDQPLRAASATAITDCLVRRIEKDAMPERTVARMRTAETEIIPVGFMGQSATTGSAGVAGSTEPDQRGTDPGDRIEQEVEKCPAAERLTTHPRVGPLTALAFVADHRQRRTLSLQQEVASKLSRSGCR
jgi:hypothetical protein